MGNWDVTNHTNNTDAESSNSENPNKCGDTISRDAVISIIEESQEDDADEWMDYPWKVTPNLLMDEVRKLPSVTPKQRAGHWIAQDIHNCHTDFKCSECGYIHSFMHLYGKPTADYTYCPNCGAKMVEPQESDHKCHTCKHYTSGENDGSCGSYICKGYSNWESEEQA